MPKKPSFDNPVRLLREALGLTQPQFAKRLGASKSLLQKIELGERVITDALADRIMILFGVRADSLKAKRGKPKPILYWRQGTLKEQLGDSNEYMAALNDETPTILEHFLRLKLDVLIDAATRKQSGVALAMTLDRWVHEQMELFGLGKMVEDVLAERKKAGKGFPWEPFITVLNREGGRTALNFILPPQAKWTLDAKTARLWTPPVKKTSALSERTAKPSGIARRKAKKV